MAKYNNSNVLELNVDELFEAHSISDIVAVEKIIDAEIERKRVELRSMVGDRYKDILTASDAIKSMKDISQHIVESIEKINSRCDTLINEVNTSNSKSTTPIDLKANEERTIIIQVRLGIILNEQIWVALDQEDYSKAAQIYLLAQHVHTGLRLLKKDIIDRVPLIKLIKSTLEMLRGRILNKINDKLQTVELTTEETSRNLNALMLLENQSSSELLKTFIKLRKVALTMVLKQTHSSVRHQVSGMVRCLTTTVHLLHDCFILYKDSNSGLIWQQLEDIVNENAPPTVSKITLPRSPLTAYIPDIIRHFRPKCTYVISKEWKSDLEFEVQDWIKFTSESVEGGLRKSLKLVTSIKGLHIIREEALKLDIPSNWEHMCNETNLPKGFNIWYYFFQNLITTRALYLVSKKVTTNVQSLQDDVKCILDSVPKTEKSEVDLRWYTWCEENDDISRTKNEHHGLSMKTKGYSPSIIKLCEKMDAKYLDILNDTSLYLYGKEYDDLNVGINFPLKSTKQERRYEDKDKLESHLRIECSKNSKEFATFLQDSLKPEADKRILVIKSLICARFLQALTDLCPNFNKCCSCNNSVEEWDDVCRNFSKTSLQFWKNWVDYVITQTVDVSSQLLSDMNVLKMLIILPKWDTIEIQEQTDEKVFKSQIKVPSQPSLALQRILSHLSNNLSGVLPHTLPKQIHLQLIDRSVHAIFVQYEALSNMNLNQRQALQFLFDVKFVSTFCVTRENMKLVQKSQDICEKLRSKVDPFDLDVFYSYLLNNIKQSTLQSQVILGCLLPSSGQLANLGILEKNKEHEKEPSILALSIPSTTTWFPLLPVTAPIQKTSVSVTQQQKDVKNSSPKTKSSLRKSAEAASSVRSGAAALFGAMASDWFT